MSEAVAVHGSPAPAMGDLDLAYKLGTLSGEVRVIKWGVGAAFVAIIAGMGVLYEAIGDVRVDLVEIRKDISGLRTDMTGLRKDVAAIDARVVIIEGKVVTIERRVATVEKDLAVLKTDVAVLKTDMADLKAMHSPSMGDPHGRLGGSHALPGHADAPGESVPTARTTPPG